VREGFLAYADRHPERTAVLEAERVPDEVFADLAELLEL